MYSATYDWGTIGHHKFEVKKARRDEAGVPDALLLDLEPRLGPLRRRRAGDQVDPETGGPRFP